MTYLRWRDHPYPIATLFYLGVRMEGNALVCYDSRDEWTRFTQAWFNVSCHHWHDMYRGQSAIMGVYL